MKKLLLILITALFTLSLFTGSENPGLPARALKDRPYYVADHELIAEIGGTPLYFDEFRYHAYTVLSELGLSTRTAELVYDKELNETILNGAIRKAANLRLWVLAALEAGIRPDEQSIYAYAYSLKGDWLTADTALLIAQAELSKQLLFVSEYGVNGSFLSNELALEFGNLGGIIRVRALFLSTSLPLITDKQIAARREQAAIFSAQISEGTADINKLIEVYGDEKPDWQFSAEGADKALYLAAAKLDINSYSGVIELEGDGLYILKRIELEPDDAVSGLYGTLRYIAASSYFYDSLSEPLNNLINNAVFTEAYKRIRPEFLFIEG